MQNFEVLLLVLREASEAARPPLSKHRLVAGEDRHHVQLTRARCGSLPGNVLGFPVPCLGTYAAGERAIALRKGGGVRTWGQSLGLSPRGSIPQNGASDGIVVINSDQSWEESAFCLQKRLCTSALLS